MAAHAGPERPPGPPLPDGEVNPLPGSLLHHLLPARLRWLLGTLLIFGAASFIVNHETFADFVFTVHNPGNVFSTGTLKIAVGSGESAFVGLVNMVAGDAVQGTVDVQNAGNIPATSYTLTSFVESANLLSGDAVDGLQLIVDRCSVAWTLADLFTCGGTQTSNVVLGTLIQTDASLGTLEVGVTDHLRVTIRLPETAGNTFQGLTAGVTFKWYVDEAAHAGMASSSSQAPSTSIQAAPTGSGTR